MKMTRTTKLLSVIILIALAIFFFNLPTSSPLPTSAKADRILVEKSAHRLTLFQNGQPLKTYKIALGRGGLGPKIKAGDNKVPEGTYKIVAHNAHSAFHRALRVGYPTPEQSSAARLAGIDPGGDIMVHGIRNGLGWVGVLQRHFDWTKGCIAVTDDEIEEVFHVVPDGAPIEIRP